MEMNVSGENEARAASERFYTALNRMLSGDAGQVAATWHQDDAVTAMHPIGGMTIGWTDVEDSFIQFAQLASGGRIDLIDQHIQVYGDLAYEIGIERGQFTLGGHPVTVDHRVTNVYRREAGTWKIVHHHADISPAILDVLSRFSAETPRPA